MSPRAKILAAPLLGPLRIFTHATPMLNGKILSGIASSVNFSCATFLLAELM